jgi:alkanesulfonate monooxygenase SsuD/methylene tetrahydromethanopterin reductase-like flavin-dependent oxidoreductase (luciferase family)
MPRQLDVFFGFSQIEVAGVLPSEQTMWDNLFRQIELADALGFGTAWVGGAHLSLAQQHLSGREPVLPHFKGEVCLNTDILHLAAAAFARTQRISIGSALHSILPNGGPIAHAEALRTFLALQPHTPWKGRTLRYGFGSGRFVFVQEAHGLLPRNAFERAAWPLVKGLLLREAVEVFTRLLRGDALASSDLVPRFIRASEFRSPAHLQAAQAALGRPFDEVEIPPFWTFDRIRLIPTEVLLDPLRLYLGTTDATTVAAANAVLPCRVFNLSITPPSVINATHERMSQVYHAAGGPWRRAHMPRTVLVFVDAHPGRSPQAQREQAAHRALRATEAWQRAMDGTVDPQRLREGMSNAVHGNPQDVAQQLHDRFHPDDTLMLWFDFNDHDTGRVEQMMQDFSEHVLPHLRALEAAA